MKSQSYYYLLVAYGNTKCLYVGLDMTKRSISPNMNGIKCHNETLLVNIYNKK